MLCAKFGWNWSSGSREGDINEKHLWQCYNDRRQQTAQLSFLFKFGKSGTGNYIKVQ